MSCAPLIGIPARLNSLRLPRKALLEVGGIPLICQVVRRVCELSLPTHPIVFTDSVEIEEAVTSRGGIASLDHAPCTSGTERVVRGVLRLIQAPNPLPQGWDQGWVINVQGDEPLLPPASLYQLIHSLELWRLRGVHVVTLASALQSTEELMNPSCVKLCVREDMRALYFSRAGIGGAQALRHIGVYAFHMDVIEVILRARTPLSLTEDLEQLSWMERGLEIGVERVDPHPKGVDTWEDLERVRRAVSEAAKF